MGQACCCCNEEATKRDSELDSYLRKWHMKDKDKIPKGNKNDYFLYKQKGHLGHSKAAKKCEILDDISRKQDMETNMPEEYENLLNSFLNDFSNNQSA